MARWRGFPTTVPAARARADIARYLASERKAGRDRAPVIIEGRTIASSFWGRAWCDNLEAYSDFASRLPRGRTYVRRGAVVHLEIGAGRVHAVVSGNDRYDVSATIDPLDETAWARIVAACAGRIDSRLSLLRGELSDDVMTIVTRPGEGLFPRPEEMRFTCTCPDWAIMCKHVAAALYGVGARLDQAPASLFELRDVDPAPLFRQALAQTVTRDDDAAPGAHRRLEHPDLSALFGIPIEERASAARKRRAKRAAHKK
ncbi:MAG: SWIM zinc finger family protein [Myxococcota bacterium]